VPPTHVRARTPITLEQRTVQVAEVVVSEVADREPQVLLGEGAEDLGRRTLELGLFQPEQDPAAPGTVLGVTQHETDGDTLTIKADRGKIVNDSFVRGRD
jgi:hypothetical protein